MALLQGLTKLNTVVTVDASKYNKTGLINGLTNRPKNYESNVYKDEDGNYFLLDDRNNYIQLNPNQLSSATRASLTDNKKVSIPLNVFGTDFESSVSNHTAPVVPLPTPRSKQQTTEETTKPTGGSGGVGSAPTGLNSGNRLTESDIRRMIDDVVKPTVMSADEIADLYGWDYNLDNILANYNAKTQQYYDDLIAKQSAYRTAYDAENARFDRKLYNAYVDSYNNAAQTRAGKALRSANLLSTMINSDQYNAENDYSMLQSINNLRAAQEREFEENPYTAEKAYNTIGTYASQLSAKLNESQVQQYKDKLLALADMYNSERQYQADVASGIAAKYSGLAGAAKWNSQSSANATNNLNDQLYKTYNYYLNQLGYTPEYANKQGYTDVRRNYDTTSYLNK